MVAAMFAGCANPAGKSGTIKVGTSGPLTGAYAVYGVAVANGLKLAFEELNAMGIKVVKYKGEGCISCGICFYNCPEPYAIKVEK